MRILFASIVALVVSHGAGVSAGALLIDINRAGSGTTATAAEFTAAGVAEDLTGVAVTGINVVSDQGSGFSGGGITFSFSSNYDASYDVSATASNSNPTGNSLLDSYVYFSNTSVNGGPADVTLSGLSALLDANTNYKLYLFGTAGLNANQNSEFTFPLAGTTKTTEVPGALSDSSVSFDFSTGGTVDSTLAFHWSRIGSNLFAVLNGIAITSAIPEVFNADFDTDDDTDGFDFLTWQRGFGTDAGTGNMAPLANGNANGDQFIDDVDFGIWEDQFGEPPPSAAVLEAPEPTTLALAGLGLVGVACVRRRLT